MEILIEGKNAQECNEKARNWEHQNPELHIEKRYPQVPLSGHGKQRILIVYRKRIMTDPVGHARLGECYN